MAGKSVESKREEFRRYLESTGVMDALTKALVALYEEPNKPENALGFILSQLGGGGGGERVAELEAENSKLKEQVVSLGGTVEGASPDAAAAASAALDAPAGEAEGAPEEAPSEAAPSEAPGDEAPAEEAPAEEPAEEAPPEG